MTKDEVRPLGITPADMLAQKNHPNLERRSTLGNFIAEVQLSSQARPKKGYFKG